MAHHVGHHVVPRGPTRGSKCRRVRRRGPTWSTAWSHVVPRGAPRGPPRGPTWYHVVAHVVLHVVRHVVPHLEPLPPGRWVADFLRNACIPSHLARWVRILSELLLFIPTWPRGRAPPRDPRFGSLRAPSWVGGMEFPSGMQTFIPSCPSGCQFGSELLHVLPTWPSGAVPHVGRPRLLRGAPRGLPRGATWSPRGPPHSPPRAGGTQFPSGMLQFIPTSPGGY